MPEFFNSLASLFTGSSLQKGALWALNTLPGFPPIIQTVHILGIAVIMGTAVLLNLRILGLALPSQSLSRMTDRVIPWFWIAFLSNIISGAFFVFARPIRYFNNPVFASKLVFLIAAVLLLVLFFVLHKQQPGYWEQEQRKWLARIMAIISILLWLGVCTGGRWIAYLEYLQYPLWTIEPYYDDNLVSFWVGVENWGLSQIIAATNWFPTLETIHVIAAAMVVGSVAWMDLRLLGLTVTDTPFPVLYRELIRWTWGAFAVAATTGLGMFITRAAGHLENPAFIAKGMLLALAGGNMAWFHFKLSHRIDLEDEDSVSRYGVSISGFFSLILWCGVMLAGRWIGHIV